MKVTFSVTAFVAVVSAAPKPAMSSLKAIREAAPEISDADILNYALTLEHLEDKFYREGLANYTAEAFADAGFDATFYDNLKEISSDETIHVSYLTAALTKAGAKPVAECTYSFGVTDPKSFVMTSSILEGVGVSAYLGAAAEIMSAEYLTAAGSILTVESRHSSYIRASLGQSPFPSPFDVPLSLNEVYTLAAPFIVSCPLGNPPLPVKAFPMLMSAPTNGNITVGKEITLLTPNSVVKPADGSSQIYGAFITVTGPVFAAATAVDGGFTLTVPEAPEGGAPIAGQTYVVLTGCNTKVTDDTVAAGPAVFERSPWLVSHDVGFQYPQTVEEVQTASEKVMSPPLPPWRPQKTLIDIYNERDRTPWYLRLIATMSAMLLMTSFLIFPTAFANGTATHLNLSRSAALIASVVIVFLSYLISFTLAFLTTSWFFHLDVIFNPHLLSSILGLVNIVYNMGIHTSIDVNSHVKAGIALAIISALVYAFGALMAFRKIHIVRTRNAMHRYASPSNATLSPPETEMQRQQLLQLLLRQDDAKLSSSPSESALQSTYKIHWPGNNTRNNSRPNTMSTIHNPPQTSRNRFGIRENSILHATSPANMIEHHEPPPDHLIGGIECVPNIVVDEGTASGSGSRLSSGPSPLRPVVYDASAPSPPTPPRRIYEPHPGQRVPSYHQQEYVGPYTHPSSPSVVPPLGSNGYPIEKPEGSNISPSQLFKKKNVQRPLDGYAVVDASAEEARAWTAA
ncbi:MAG: hypothetical protein Q9217_001545 [Psora testacea]